MRFYVLTRVTGPLNIGVLEIIWGFLYVNTRDLEELYTSTLKMEAAGSS